MSDYLTNDDYNNYGGALIDVTRRAALEAVGPHIQNLAQQNAQLQQRLAVESRRRLDDQVARAVPDYKSIDADPRWHRYLLGVDALSGRVRQQWLNDAISSGDAARVKFIFDSFKREVGSTQAPTSTGTTTARGPYNSRSQSSSSGRQVYTREMIGQLYERRRRGEITEAAFQKIEQDIFDAQHTGRVVGHAYLTK